MAVGALVAASDMPAGEAQAEVAPPPANPEAILAAIGGRGDPGCGDRLGQMLANPVHDASVPPAADRRDTGEAARDGFGLRRAVQLPIERVARAAGC